MRTRQAPSFVDHLSASPRLRASAVNLLSFSPCFLGVSVPPWWVLVVALLRCDSREKFFPEANPSWSLRTWLPLCLAVLLVSLSSAQSPNNKNTDLPRQSKTADDNTFKVNVRLVNVFASVTDAHGSPVGDLTKDDFKVLEDGVPQAISVFDRESDLPLNIVLAVDT